MVTVLTTWRLALLNIATKLSKFANCEMPQKKNVYKNLLVTSDSLLESSEWGKIKIKVKRLRTKSLTLAVTFFFWNRIGELFNNQLVNDVDIAQPKPSIKHRVGFPSWSHFTISSDKHEEWILMGLRETIKNYRQLIDSLNNINSPPKVVILYNPSSYEIYRGILCEINSDADRSSLIQLNVLKKFADENQIVFINLIPGFREVVEEKKLWMFGEHDSVHWSPIGTKIAAEVILNKLNQVLVDMQR